jgi:molecular chaperone IbpA
MTLQHQLTMADFPKFFLGFDRLQDDFFSNVADKGYPRYNVVKVGDAGYRIELAIPGWDKKDISIQLHKNILTIEGIRPKSDLEVEPAKETYIHKGLSGKGFSRSFKVGDFIVLDKAYLQRGLLCIDLSETVPEEEQPISVDIL